MDIAKEAQELRIKFKELGWSRNDISVTISRYSMGQSLSATIKPTTPHYRTVEKLIDVIEDIERCEQTGEIMSGCNTYCDLYVDDNVREETAAPYKEHILKALEDVKKLGDYGTIEIEGLQGLDKYLMVVDGGDIYVKNQKE